MAFIFNLQKLMDLRGKYEEQAKNYLNKKINERIQAEEKIEKINKTIKQFDEDFNKELHISVSPDRFKQLLEYKEHLKKQRDILVKEYQAKLKEEESAAVRIPGYLKKSDVRIEYRTGDASCNIYYALSAMILSGLDGIKNTSDPFNKGYSAEDHKEDKIFPLNLNDVLDGLKKDNDYLTKVFPEELIDLWIKIKKEEAEFIYNAPTPGEYELYF